MIEAATRRRQANVTGGLRVRLLVATWAEALPLLGFGPRVTGMGRRDWDLSGCDAVISAGFAGACQPGLRPGDILLAGGVPAGLGERLGAVSGELRTLGHIAGPAEKAALGREGVAAVDMETAWLQAACEVPFLAVRVIIDRVQDRPLGLATARHYLLACTRLRRAVAAAKGFQ